VDALIEKDYNIVILDNLKRGKLENISSHLNHPNCTFIEGDLRNPEDISKAMTGCDIVFHLAAQSNVLGAIQDLDYSFQTNVAGTFNLLKMCQQHKIKRLIFTSSREAYGEAQYLPVDEQHPLNSKNTYGASKIAGETYCRVFKNISDFELIILRLANVYGTRDFDRVIPIFLNNTQNDEPIIIYGGEQVIDFVSVNIVIQALIESMLMDPVPDGPVNIGSGKGTTLFELADKIKSLMKSKSKIKILPARSAEVVKFTASITKMKKLYDIDLPDDPLYDLITMIDDYKNHDENQTKLIRLPK
jgi:nucleoside-diphosphate-sugar epimerase